MAEGLLEHLVAIRAQSSAGAVREFLGKRVAECRDSLALAETALQRIQEKTGILAPDDQTRALVNGAVQIDLGRKMREVELGMLRAQVGPDVEILGGPRVAFLLAATPAEVRREVRRILSSGIMRGGRFVLREGNNLPPGVPVENLWAMYDTAKEYGKY